MTKFFDKFYNSLDKLHSIMNVPLENDYIIDYILNKKETFVPKFFESDYENKKVTHNEIILKHLSGFYIYINKKEVSKTYRIIYEASQIEEVKFFINSLKRIK
jgi:hypothetical protein